MSPPPRSQKLVFAAGVKLMPAGELPSTIAEKIAAEEGDHAIFSSTGRSTAKVVSSEFAAFLRHFREPTPIVDAVMRFAAETATAPESVLEEIFEPVNALMQSSFLIDAERKREVDEAEREPLTAVGPFCVERAVQLSADVEVYRARAPDGVPVALKIETQARSHAARMIRREARVLETLDGQSAPALLETGEHQGRAYFVSAWIAGVTVEQAADAIRRQSGAAQDRRLLQLCIRVVECYARFHRQGVMHGDVHGRNVLVDGQGAVTVIDFGLSREELAGRRTRRGGVGFYFDPEFAGAWLAKTPSPMVNEPAEQYSLAVLLYRLVTGQWYLPFALDKERAFRQIVEAPVIAFRDHGRPAWSAMETVLGKALSKNPELRFSDVGGLLQSLRALETMTVMTPPPQVSTRIHTYLEKVLHRLHLSDTEESLQTPKASVNMGLAGKAYAVLRLALNHASPQLLALADLLAERAHALRPDPAAFWSEEREITEAMCTRQSVLHAGPGICVVRALIASARGDVYVTGSAISQFVEECRGASAWDFSFGRAGILVAGANLLRAARCQPLVRTSDLIDLLTTLESQLLDELARRHHAEGIRGNLGAAHGWTGCLYAILAWRSATSTPLPDRLPEWLDALAACGQLHGRGMRWPRTLDARKPDYLSSWCNGSAGFVHLWLKAYEFTRDERHLALAHDATWTTWDTTHPAADLCCGSAGRAYALLAFARATEDAEWLERAITLADDAVSRVDQSPLSTVGLIKGPPGVWVLASDLARGLPCAAMPFFGNEP